MQDPQYRDDLPPIPQRLRSRPIERGFPVPWFVAEVDGHYDFRVIDARKFQPAIKKRLCWVCGQKLGAYLAFGIGPMCVINRTISEPPSHRDCMEWSMKACPFLAQRQEVRRETHLPEGIRQPGGNPIDRQPGAACLWITKSYTTHNLPRGDLLFTIGDPVEVLWFAHGRAATRAEVLESIESGYPLLMKMAEMDGAAGIRELKRRRDAAMVFLPKEGA